MLHRQKNYTANQAIYCNSLFTQSHRQLPVTTINNTSADC